MLDCFTLCRDIREHPPVIKMLYQPAESISCLSLLSSDNATAVRAFSHKYYAVTSWHGFTSVHLISFWNDVPARQGISLSNGRKWRVHWLQLYDVLLLPPRPPLIVILTGIICVSLTSPVTMTTWHQHPYVISKPHAAIWRHLCRCRRMPLFGVVYQSPLSKCGFKCCDEIRNPVYVRVPSIQLYMNILDKLTSQPHSPVT